MELRIIRTNHEKVCENCEHRNYHVVSVVTEYEGNDAKIAMEQFQKNHKPSKGSCNVFLYKTKWAAEQEDYRILTGNNYLKYADEHNYCLIDTEIHGSVFMSFPMIDDIYEKIVKSTKYKTMTFDEIKNDIYKKSIKKDKEQSYKYDYYMNE